MNDATKEVAQLEQPGFDRSVTIKIAIFTSIERRQQFIADSQNQFTELFVKFLCGSQVVFHCFSLFIPKHSMNAFDISFSNQFAHANVIYRALRGLHRKS